MTASRRPIGAQKNSGPGLEEPETKPESPTRQRPALSLRLRLSRRTCAAML